MISSGLYTPTGARPLNLLIGNKVLEIYKKNNEPTDMYQLLM